MFDFVFVAISQVIEAEAVFFPVHNLAQFRLQKAALGRIQQALKDGVLHPLTVVYTLLCDLPQAPTPGGILSIYVISN